MSKITEKDILPQSGQLVVDGETITAEILDAEFDVLDCTFDNGGCVNIKTEGYTYIKLSLRNLEYLQELIIDAEKKYKTLA